MNFIYICRTVVYICLFLKVIYLFILAVLGLCCLGFLWLLQVGAPPCKGAQTSHCSGFSCFRAWVSRPVGLVALQHVGSSRAGDWTCVPCIGSWILNHWTTREVPMYIFFFFFFVLFKVLTYLRHIAIKTKVYHHIWFIMYVDDVCKIYCMNINSSS